MGKPAQQLTKAICDLLRYKGWHVQKGGASASVNKLGQFFRTGEVGSPDIQAHLKKEVVCVNEMPMRRETYVRWLCIEVKAGKDRLNEKQAAWLKLAERYGATVIIARSSGQVAEAIEHL